MERDTDGRILGGEIIQSSEVMEEESNEVQFTNVENAKVESPLKTDPREKIHHTDSCSKFLGRNFGIK